MRPHAISYGRGELCDVYVNKDSYRGVCRGVHIYGGEGTHSMAAGINQMWHVSSMSLWGIIAVIVAIGGRYSRGAQG